MSACHPIRFWYVNHHEVVYCLLQKIYSQLLKKIISCVEVYEA